MQSVRERRENAQTRCNSRADSANAKCTRRQRKVKKSYYVKVEQVWTREDDEQLMNLVKIYGVGKWRMVAKYMLRSIIKCHKRYLQLVNQNVKLDMRWMASEDRKLRDFVLGQPCVQKIRWQDASEILPGRLPKQCRERWLYQVDPCIVKHKWTIEEDIQIVKLYQQCGSQWKNISDQMAGRRNDNQIKNRFNQSLKKRIINGEFSNIAPKLQSVLQGTQKLSNKSVEATVADQKELQEVPVVKQLQPKPSLSDKVQKQIFKIDRVATEKEEIVRFEEITGAQSGNEQSLDQKFTFSPLAGFSELVDSICHQDAKDESEMDEMTHTYSNSTQNFIDFNVSKQSLSCNERRRMKFHLKLGTKYDDDEHSRCENNDNMFSGDDKFDFDCGENDNHNILVSPSLPNSHHERSMKNNKRARYDMESMKPNKASMDVIVVEDNDYDELENDLCENECFINRPGLSCNNDEMAADMMIIEEQERENGYMMLALSNLLH